MRKLLLLALFALPLTAQAQFSDNGLAAGTFSGLTQGQTRTLTSDTLYTVDGVAFVESGAVLNIEAGTVIKFEDGTNTNASALVIARGGKIFAEGTATAPIVMTSVLDDLDDPDDGFQDVIGQDNPVPLRGLWGGVVMLGRATTNNSGTNAEKEIEGLNEIFPNDERIRYGGTDDNDNSGVLRYVSIRHTGINIGSSSGNEIQGLTAGAVGRGTTIEYVESYASADDGFEFFGGTVDTKYLVAAFCADDAFDTDEGFRGRGQFWFALQGPDETGRAAEMDGATGDEFFTPFSTPVVRNATYIGPGVNSTADGDGAELIIIRDNSAASYYQSLFTGTSKPAITVEDIDNTGARTEDSRKRLEGGQLELEGNIFFGFGVGNGVAQYAPQDFVASYLSTQATNTRSVDPMLRGVSRTTDGGLDPRPMAGSPALTSNAPAPDDAFFTNVSYTGAFGSSLWIDGWSALSALGYTAQQAPSDNKPAATFAGLTHGQTRTLSSDSTYTVDGVAFVESGAVLNIEAGTVIKFEDGTNTNASALVIARGGKIFAEGTATAPIVMTSVLDDLDDPDDGFQDVIGQANPVPLRGLWGGVVMLGRATTNNSGTNAEKEIEGLNEIFPNDERIRYGGTDDNDNSGVLRYVSIRHTGINIGSSSGNEIQGLTAGAVGRGTTIEYVESYASADDGFEFFGGTVDTKYLIAAFCADDAFDTDEGFRGRGQFWFALQGPDETGRAAEMDGATGDEFFTPFSTPVVRNATYIGPGVNSTADGDGAELIIIRDNSAASYYQSLFTGTSKPAITVEDIDNTGARTEDSRKRLEGGQLKLEGNIFFGFGVGNTSRSTRRRISWRAT